MQEIVQGHACIEVAFETDTAARNRLWEARHTLAYAYIHGHPGKKMMVTDVCLPISELAGAVSHARENLMALELPGGIVGHVGDGNFHALIMMDMDNPEEVAKAQEFNERIALYALERGGTCTGEHGVGIGKKKYQQQEHGAALDVMAKIKAALDPNNLLNPGKNINVDHKELTQ